MQRFAMRISVRAAVVTCLALATAAAHAETRQAEAASLREYVERLAGPLSPRDGYEDSLTPVAEYIFNELSRFGEPTYQRFPLGIEQFRNVELVLPGKSAETIIIGAHYDAFNGLPGADDNASGVAGLLELARLAASEELPVTLLFVAYALEEPPNFATPNMGSAWHARAMSKRLPVPFLMINLEMIGYFCDEPKCQKFPMPLMGSFFPDTGNFIAVIGRGKERGALRTFRKAFRDHTQLPVETLSLPAPGKDLSDHRNYWRTGMPAVMVTDTAFQRNPNYHTPTDTPDTLDYKRMAMVVDGVLAAITMLGDQRAAVGSP